MEYYIIMFAIWETSCSVFLRRTETNLERLEEKIKSVLCTLRSGLHAAPLPFMIHLFYVRENGYT